MAGARRNGPPSEEQRPQHRTLESIEKLKDPRARLRACNELLEREPEDPAVLSLAAETMIALGRVVEALGNLHRAAELHLGRGEALLAAEVCGRLLAIDPRHQPSRALARTIRESPAATPAILEVLDRWRRQRVREGAPVVLATARGRMATELEPTSETRLPPEPQRAQRVSEVARRQADPGGRPKPDRASAGSRRVPASIDAPTLVEEAASRPSDERPLFSEGAASSALRTVTDVGDPVARSPGPPATAPATAPRSPTAPLTPASGISLLPPELIAKGIPRRLARHELLFHERDAGDDLYLVRRGQLELLKWERSPRRARVAVLEPGEVLGELALLGDGIQHLSAKALEPCELVQIPRSAVKPALTESPALERRLRAQYRDRLQTILLRTSPLFVGLDPGVGAELISRMKPKRLPAGQIAVKEGTSASALYLVLLGTLRVTVAKDGETVPLGKLEDCDFFGEISLLSGEPATATVETRSFVQLLVMSRVELERTTAEHAGFRRALAEEGKRRERVIRAILRGTARFDETRGVVVYLPHKK
jgi:CRP-like cAMP-binding protein